MPDGTDLGAGMRLAFELFDAAEALFRQRLRRERPGISEEEIDREFGLWLSRRPGAEHGDAPGRVRQLDQFK